MIFSFQQYVLSQFITFCTLCSVSQSFSISIVIKVKQEWIQSNFLSVLNMSRFECYPRFECCCLWCRLIQDLRLMEKSFCSCISPNLSTRFKSCDTTNGNIRPPLTRNSVPYDWTQHNLLLLLLLWILSS